jgi:hypothetical protein
MNAAVLEGFTAARRIVRNREVTRETVLQNKSTHRNCAHSNYWVLYVRQHAVSASGRRQEEERDVRDLTASLLRLFRAEELLYKFIPVFSFVLCLSLVGCLHKSCEQRMWLQGLRFEFRMELAAQEERMIRYLDNFYIGSIRC